MLYEFRFNLKMLILGYYNAFECIVTCLKPKNLVDTIWYNIFGALWYIMKVGVRIEQ